jgi:hypothetical protein
MSVLRHAPLQPPLPSHQQPLSRFKSACSRHDGGGMCNGAHSMQPSSQKGWLRSSPAVCLHPHSSSRSGSSSSGSRGNSNSKHEYGSSRNSSSRDSNCQRHSSGHRSRPAAPLLATRPSSTAPPSPQHLCHISRRIRPPLPVWERLQRRRQQQRQQWALQAPG